jgi:hypothetical protein
MSLPSGSPCSVMSCGELSVAQNLCARHYKRWQRYGDPSITKRPSDWGSKEKHPLYSTWSGLRRFHWKDLCDEWKNDFWVFVEDVIERQTGARLVRISKTGPYSKQNMCWQVIKGTPVDRESAAKYQREWRADNIRSVKSADMKRYYGITMGDYERILDSQDHSCAICKGNEGSIQSNGKPFSLAVDHCHDSKKVRGLLCSNCNRGLGFFGDNIATLLSAIEYLKKSSS